VTDASATAVDVFARPLAELPDPLPIRPLSGSARRSRGVAVRPPGSKSLTNRVLVLAGLASGDSTVRGAATQADDVQRMLGAIEQLGARVERRSDSELIVKGVGGRWNAPAEPLDLGNAGTAARFLAASALLADGPVVVDGNDRMRQRPIGDLCALLEDLGASIEHLQAVGCPPVRVTPPAESFGGDCIDVPTTASSQFVSGLLLVAPFVEGGLTIRFTGEITSQSYVEMTLALLDRLGASVRTSEALRVARVGPAIGARPGIPAFATDVEADASGATYWWAAAALTPGLTCSVEGLGPDSVQGDAQFAGVLARMGALVEPGEHSIACAHAGSLAPVLIDMSDMPDAAVTLAVACAFAKGPSVIRGLRTLRVKECDRLAALQTELARIDVRVETGVRGDEGAISITPPKNGVDCSQGAPPVEFDTYDDHRMAMALALVGLRRPNVAIRDPACVAKTYPDYWEHFAKLYASAGAREPKTRA